MDQLWRLVADAITMMTLAMMASSAWSAWKRVTPDTLVPMQLGAGGKVSWRARRPWAIAAWPVFCVCFLFAGMAFAQFQPEDSILFAVVRIQMAVAFLFGQLLHLRIAFRVLQEEGALLPPTKP